MWLKGAQDRHYLLLTINGPNAILVISDAGVHASVGVIRRARFETPNHL
jgi:hypothetical protein